MWLKPIALGAGIVAFVSILIYLLTVQETLNRSGRIGQRDPANVLRLEGAFLQKHRDGRLEWELWAEKAIYLEEEGITDLNDVRFRIHRLGNGVEPRAVIEGTSRRARLEGDQKTILLEGDVRVKEGEAIELRGERMIYHHREGRLTSSDPVWVRHHRTIHRGTALDYRIAEGKLILSAPTIYQ